MAYERQARAARPAERACRSFREPKFSTAMLHPLDPEEGKNKRTRAPGTVRGESAYLFVFPAVLFVLFLLVLPTISGIVISFQDLDPSHLRRWLSAPFVGLKNYRDVLGPASALSKSLWASLFATVAYTVLSVGAGFSLGMVGALLLNENFPGRGFARAFALIPWITPNVVSSYVWRMLLLRDTGPINALLLSLHVIHEKVYWLIGETALISAVIARVWTTWPFFAIMLLAALQAIPPELYEAGKVDGVNPWQSFWHITWPTIFPVARILLLLQFIWTMKDFNTIYVMYGATPPESVNLLPIMIYSFAFQSWDFGHGAAMSVLLMLAMVSICYFYIRYYIREQKG
jgi:multiple sugar transport system permease protein